MILLILLAQNLPPGGEWDPMHSSFGTQSNELHGHRLDWIGDVDGDGWSDLIVGSPNYPTGVVGSTGGAAFLYSGSSGVELDRLIGDFIPVPYSFAKCVSRLGDVTGDGRPEVAIGKPASQPGTIAAVQVYSVLPWMLLYEASAPHDQSSLGAHNFAGGTDLNGDGLPDLVAADGFFKDNGTSTGAVHAFNGLDGSLLWRAVGQTLSEFGQMVICPGDVNGDGYSDVVTRSNAGGGAVHVLSGFDGSEIYRFLGDYSFSSIGTDRLAPLGDADSDGLPDFIVGQMNVQGVSNGMATIHRGYDGALIHRWEGQFAAENFANRVGGPGDLNGDGYQDYTVGAYVGIGQGRVYVYSGRDFGLMQVIYSPSSIPSTFGFTLGNLGSDVNGDGGAEIAIGDYSEPVNGVHNAGAVYLFSFDRYLRADALNLSAAAGGALHFTLDFPATEAGRSYLLLASDDLPGSLTVRGVGIPLVMTPLLQKMLNAPPHFFDQPQGNLDANGDAIVTAALPPNALNAYVGRTIKFAAVSMLTSNQPSLSSAASWVEISQ